MPELIDSSCNNRPPLYHMVVSRRRLNLDWNSWWGQCFIIRWLTMYGGSGVRHPLLRGFNFQNLGISGIPVKCFGAPGLIHFRKKLRKRNESYCCFTSEKYWRSFQFISFMWLLRDICSCCVILIALAWHEMLSSVIHNSGLFSELDPLNTRPKQRFWEKLLHCKQFLFSIGFKGTIWSFS